MNVVGPGGPDPRGTRPGGAQERAGLPPTARETTRQTLRPLIRPREWLLAALVALILIVALVWTGQVVNGFERQIAFDEDSTHVVRAMTAAVSELEEQMGELVASHYGDIVTSGSGALVAPFERFSGNSPHLLGIGRYAAIDAEKREAFERADSTSGLYAFRVTALDAEGHAHPRAPAERHFPITLLEPMDPARLRLLGADLGAEAHLATVLESLVEQDRTLVTTFPGHWPLGDGFVLFHATYRGQHVPHELDERRRQLDGGYWMAVDTDAMLASLGEHAERFGLALHVENAGERKTLLERDAAGPGELHFPGLYQAHSRESRWPFGNSAIALSISAESGMSSRLLLALTLLVLLVPALIGTTLAFLHGSRLRVRERLRAADALNAEREKADRTLDAIEDAVFTLDNAHRVLHLNPAASRLLGHSREATIGHPLAALIDLRHERDGRAFDPARTIAEFEGDGIRDVDLVRGAPEDARSEEGLAHSEGRRRPLAASEYRIDDTVWRLTVTRVALGEPASGEVGGDHTLVLRDISAERRLMQRLVHQANHDPLTGCTNRRHFEAKLGELLEGIAANGRRHALCYIDLDQFKVVNDTCGHGAGDRLLQELTVELMSLCREGDVLSRLGGDEFGLILLDVNEAAALSVARRVLRCFRGYTFRHGERNFSVKASIGFVPLDRHSGSIAQVMAAADLACYAAKDNGRDELYVWSADDENIARRSNELSHLPELQRALTEDLFELHVQAIARISAARPEGVVDHFEFLLRPCDEAGRTVPPLQLIEAAERYGLMREIDRWVIERALTAIAAIGSAERADLTFSINLSGQSAADPTLIEFIENAYERHAIDPECIWFELTETAAISHFSIAIELTERIRALGSKVALDDFGSGLSSFGYLKRIPVDVLKIDGQFVRNMADDPIDRTMVRAIDEVGKSMGIVTVAEFVEDERIVGELVRIGVDYAQGYHIARPCPLPEALAARAASREAEGAAIPEAPSAPFCPRAA